MPDPKRLDIGIKVAADTTGATQTVDALKQVDLTASKTYNALAVAQARTEVAEKNQTAEQREANQDRARLALQQVLDQDKIADASKRAENGLKGLGKTTKEVTKLGADFSSVVDGLARGDLAGLAQAGRGVKDVLGTLAATAGGVLLPAITSAAGIFAIFKSALNDNQKAIARYYKNAADASETYKAKLEAATAANEKLVAKQVEDIKKIAAAYDEVTAAIDKAYARQQKIDTAKAGLANAQLDNQEKKALAAAKTPEQKAAIQQQFSDKRLVADTKAKFNEFNAIDNRADVETTNARKAQLDAQDSDRDIQAAIDEAKRKSDEATSTAALLLKANGATAPTLQAQAEAKAAKAALDQLTKESEQSFKANSETFAKSQEKIDAATASKEENAINRDAFRQTLVGKQIDEQASAKDLQKQLGEKTKAFQPGDDAALKEIQSLRAQIAAAKGTGNLIGGLLNEDTKNQSTAASQADQRAKAGIVAPKVEGSDGGTASITKDGQEIKVTSASTVAELKKVSSAYSDSAKAIEKATPLLTKNAAQNAKVIAEYHAEVIATLQAFASQQEAQKQQIAQIRRELQAKADHS